ncbi:hypothetical protein QFZ60_001765 [Arthrobacter sp. B2I5]|nr:hypothetical protein [Arthrobacter sp. B2I5]
MFGITFHTPKMIKNGSDQNSMRVSFRRASSVEAADFLA